MLTFFLGCYRGVPQAERLLLLLKSAGSEIIAFWPGQYQIHFGHSINLECHSSPILWEVRDASEGKGPLGVTNWHRIRVWHLLRFQSTKPHRRSIQSPTVLLTQNCSTQNIKLVSVEKASILGTLDTVIDDPAHIPETNRKLFSIVKGRSHEINLYLRRCLRFSSRKVWQFAGC